MKEIWKQWWVAWIALVLFSGCASSLIPVSARADQTLTETLDGVARRYGPLPGVALHYEREVISRTLSMMGNGVRGDLASGRLFIKPPSFLRLEQESPSSEVIVMDGKSLRWYLPDQKELRIYPPERFGREMRFLTDLFSGLVEARKAFQARFSGTDPQGLFILELVPDPPWEQVDHLLVKVGPGHEVRCVEIHNRMGGITRFLLVETKKKTAFPAGFFELSVPEGVKVIREP